METYRFGRTDFGCDWPGPGPQAYNGGHEEDPMKALSLVTMSAILCSLGLAAETQKKDLDLKAEDGTTLKASYFSPGRPGPGILLLHQCNMDRHAWDGLAQDLANAGFHVLTLDFRGFGDSGGDHANRTAEREKWPSDVDTAYAYLMGQKGVQKTQVAAGGASCGVGQASDLATRHHEIKALVLLSGGASAAAKAYFSATPSVAVFGAASEGDTNAAKGIKEAVEASKSPQSHLKLYPGTEHGVPMFAKNAELEPMIVKWLKGEVAGSL
jgi:dienelactone hydrolase